MDALSEAFAAVHMTGAIFFNAESTAPWGFAVPHGSALARVLTPQPEHLVHYHLITEGEALVQVDGAPNVTAAPGDIVIFPHGDRHAVSYGSPSKFVDTAGALGKFLAGDSAPRGLAAEAGYALRMRLFRVRSDAERLFLAGLPALIKINIRGDVAGEWLERSLRHLVGETNQGARRRGVACKDGRGTLHRSDAPLHGALAGGADRLAGGRERPDSRCRACLAAPKAVSLLDHRGARCRCRSFALGSFGALRAPSRGTAAHLSGALALQLAARKLQTTRNTIMQVAPTWATRRRLSIAIQRQFGLPPAQYRKKLRKTVRRSRPR